jgi:GT2 family glycosyltransferase
MQPRFSIVIPAFNSSSSLQLLLRCLEAQQGAINDYECIVIDDGSTDSAAPFLKEYNPKFSFRYFVNDHNLGRAQARELGWQQSLGEIVIFLDSDMLPAPDWLEGYREAFAGETLDVVSGVRYSVDLDASRVDCAEGLARLVGVELEELFVRDAAGQFHEIEARAKLGQFSHAVYEKLETEMRQVYEADPQSLICAWSFMASNSAVRRSLLQETSGFNPCLRRFDDLELAIRLWELGARFGFAGQAKAFHLCAEERPIYWPGMNDLLMLFSRHPYRLVFMMHLWMFYHSQAHNASPPALFNHLLSVNQANEEAQQLNLTEQFQAIYKQPFPIDARYDMDRVIEYYSSSPYWTKEQVASGLDQAIRRGVYTEQRAGRFYFDIYHIDNWLRDCTPILQRWLAPHVLNHNRTPFQHTQQPSELLTFRCRGTYEITVPAEAIAGVEGEVILNLSVPVEHTCQSDVKIADCSPANMLDYKDRAGGMIMNLPVNGRPGEDIKIHYSFTCLLHEFAPVEKERGALAPAELSRFLRPSFPPEHMVKAKALLDQIITDRTKEPYAVARMIYSWIQHQVVFIETPFMYPYYLILDTGLGPCVQMTRLFINLCRLTGIPAREQCGALLPQDPAKLLRDLSEGTPHELKVLFRGATPFAHTWAEFYDPARGWVPIEIHGFGRKCVTALNIVDKHVMEEVYEVYDEIKKPLLFGSMSPFRIYTSEQANKLPVYPLVKTGGAVKALQETAGIIRYNLYCSFMPL